MRQALNIVIAPAPGAELQFNGEQRVPDVKVAHVPAGAAFAVVPPWDRNTGDLLEVGAYLLLACVPASPAAVLGDEVMEAATQLGFTISQATTNPERRAAFADADGSKYTGESFSLIATAMFANWANNCRPENTNRAQKRKADRDAQQAGEVSNKKGSAETVPVTPAAKRK